MSDKYAVQSASRKWEHWTPALIERVARRKKAEVIRAFTARYGYEPAVVTMYGHGVRSIMDPPFYTRAAIFAEARA